MSYEAMPCVLKNEDGTPMYGLLIKPLQNQVVIQLAPNQQQQQAQPQQQPVVASPLCQPPGGASGVPLLAVPSQIPSTSSWNGNGRPTGTVTGTVTPRRHYPTILPRETTPSSASKVQQTMPWGSPPSTSGGYSSCAAGSNNGFAALVQANSKTPPCVNAVKLAYTAAMPSSSPLSTPALLPFLNGTGQQTPAAFTQALSAYGLIPSQSLLEMSGVDSQLEEQNFGNVFDQPDGGMHIHLLDTSSSGVLSSNDCHSNSSAQNNFVSGGCSSTDLDMLLRDIDLNEITNSLMPLLQDCGTDSEATTPEVFSERNIASSVELADDKSSIRAVEDVNQAGLVGFDVQADAARAQMSSTTSTRPPCRYQGLLSNTSNLRVGCTNGLNPPSGMYSIFDPAVGASGESSLAACSASGDLSGCVAVEKSNVPNQVMVVQPQPAGGEFDHAPHEATTPDSGIQSIGDSPHAVPQSSPMQFFSASPDARRRRLSANGTTCNSTAVPQMELPQSRIQPQLVNYQAVQSSLDQHIGDESAASDTWTQKFMQPLCVNTAFFEPISECESSPTVRVPESPAAASHFPVLNASRCYSPSTTSSDCGNEPSHRRPPIGSVGAKRRRRTKKRSCAGASNAATGGADFEDMPILQPEMAVRHSPMDVETVDPTRQSQADCQTQQSHDLKNEKEQLTLNVSDPNALVEKLLSVVPKEQLASLRRILDERLNGGAGNQGKGASTSAAGNGAGYSQSRTSKTVYRDSSAVEKTLSRWQSKNAGYASDTSDVSSMADIIGSHGNGKKTAEEEGDSAASSGARWGGEIHSSQSQAARRSSASSSSALTGEAKKQDPLKKLLEYRAKARSNCVKPMVGTRVNELIPSIIQLHINDSDCEVIPDANSMAKAFKRIQDRLAMLKDVPRLEKENESAVVEKQRLVAFNSLQNLELEASDDDDDDDEAASPELTPECSVETPPPPVRAQETPEVTENNPENDENVVDADVSGIDDATAAEPAKDTRPTARKKKKDTAAKDNESTQDLVQVKENPQRQNISVKIKLSLLRGTSLEPSAKCDKNARSVSRESERKISSPAVESEENVIKENAGKGKRLKSRTTLPPKKRFKEGETAKEVEVAKEKSRSKEEDGNRKRRHIRSDVGAPNCPKKQKLCLEPVVVLEPLELEDEVQVLSENIQADTAKNGVEKSKGPSTTRLFRRCSICKNWLRVEDNDSSECEGSLCSDCRAEKRGEKETSSNDSHTSTTPASSKPSASAQEVEKRKKADRKKDKTTRRTKPAAAAMSSLNDASTGQPILLPGQCRILGDGAEGKEFQLPYDLWYQQKYQKDRLSKNPSQNYKKLRSNVYVDPKPTAAVKHHVCNCKLPADGSAKACGDSCLNRLMYTECCGSSCPCGDQCTNNRFQKREWVNSLQVFESSTGKGMGVKAKESVAKGTFICEYLGEVVSTKTFGERMATWYKDCNHHYALNLDAGMIIDGYRSGSVARFINHSCEPNCEIQKWWINGHYRIGVFASRDINPGEELTYDYKFHAFNTPQACLCGTESCSGFVDGTNRSDRAKHQARKSKPKRSDAKEEQSDSSASKLHLLKPMSHRERVTVVKGRVFLLRNVDGMRRKLQALNAAASEVVASTDDEKRKAEIISSQLTALKTSRSVRTRRSALSENDAQIQKLTGLVQLLKSLLQTLCEAQDKDGKPLLARFRKVVSRSKKHTAPSGQQEKSEGLDFGLLERNVEKGLYQTPEAFDKDAKSMFNHWKSNVSGEESVVDNVLAVKELERLYESGKAAIAEQLKDALGFQLTAGFLPNLRTETRPKNRSSSRKNGRRLEDWSDDLYWDTCTPFVVTNEMEENSHADLWIQKADAFDEEDDKVHCICGICEDDGIMIQCDRCRYWQHSECVGVTSELEEYACEFCVTGNPSLFKDVILSPQPEIRLQHCIYYRALIKNGLQIRVGECVYVKKNIDEKHKQLLRNFNRQCVQKSKNGHASIGEAEDGSNNGLSSEACSSEQTFYRRSELRVFRVERLFTGPKGVKFVFGYYFARPHETFCEPSRRFYRNEIFVTPLYDTLPLDAVVGRCLVMDVQTYCKGRPKYPKFAEEDVYICEYKLDKAQRLFDKMHARFRYPVCVKPYIFHTFTDRLKVKRDFTPFNRSPRGGDQGKRSKTSARSDSGYGSEINEKKRLVAKKKKRVEQIVDKVKRAGHKERFISDMLLPL